MADRTYSMRISFVGMNHNALRSLGAVQSKALRGAEDSDKEDEIYRATHDVRSCISAYHDSILALLRGDTSIEDARQFWFGTDDPVHTGYEGSVITFSKKENGGSGQEKTQ